VCCVRVCVSACVCSACVHACASACAANIGPVNALQKINFRCVNDSSDHVVRTRHCT